MLKQSREILHSLSFRLTLLLALVLLAVVAVWGSLVVADRKQRIAQAAALEADRLVEALVPKIHHALLANSKSKLPKMDFALSWPEGTESVLLYTKTKQRAFSTPPVAVYGKPAGVSEACLVCHAANLPSDAPEQLKRISTSNSPQGFRLVKVVTPVRNDPTCWSASCHVHPKELKVLAFQEAVISLKSRDSEIRSLTTWLIILYIVSLALLGATVSLYFEEAVRGSIQRLIRRIKLIGQGRYQTRKEDREPTNELDRLGLAIDAMGAGIAESQKELNRQRDEYQQLFEQVPCLITVQDRDLRLVRFNRAFAEQFDAKPGAYCYQVYKGREERCDPCPVLQTFRDGESHSSEEIGITRDDPICYRIVRTSAIKGPQGDVPAVMQMSVDITAMKRLEEQIRISEKKYRSIFDTIPNPVFILDRKHFKILDCNQCVQEVYGFAKEELLNRSFLHFFEESEQQTYALELRNSEHLIHTRQRTKDGRSILVNIRVSHYEYMGREALLATSSDIIRVLTVKDQLVQASKMATLGEMAAGIAHELNQPLSVIKSASSFMLNKSRKGERVREEVFKAMVEEIDSHVDRASGIITHVREFGRKSEATKEPVQINLVIGKAVDIFSQQLKLREIHVVKELQPDLPPIMADMNRLEQVFINLLLNARDAIEEKREQPDMSRESDKIRLKTARANGKVRIEIQDSGIGIPQALLDRIFEPFFTTKKLGKGTGLGLPISYGIVHDYDGTLQVETAEGEGTTFIIQFPAG